VKLFSLPDGTVDRKDRAQWLTPIFDLAFAGVAALVYGPFCVCAQMMTEPGQVAGTLHEPGQVEGMADCVC
jgi:hypothetical protein